MDKPSHSGHGVTRNDGERRVVVYRDRPTIAGVPVRADDVEPTKGLHSIAILFRVLAGLLGVIIVLQILNTIASPLEFSYGALIAESIRLAIFAGLLWGAGELADLFVKSHHDLRSIRILLARLTHQDIGDRGDRPGP